MGSELIIIFIQFSSVIITLVSVIILYKTIKENKNLNQNIIFNEVVNQERGLRIKLNEYKQERYVKLKRSQDFTEITLSYDTLLFNYYEYLALIIYKRLINESSAKLYFYELVKDTKELFDSSILFEGGYAKREQYPGILWLFKKWKI